MARKEEPAPRTEAEKAYAGAVQGADVYRAVRSVVRRHHDVLRIGNRFVRGDAFREIAFVAVGRASLSGGYALVDALGDSLTQGLLIGPDDVPAEIPFLHQRVASDAVGAPGAAAAVGAVQELAAGLTDRDLLVLLLSPGALGLLALPPPGLDGEGFRRLLEQLRVAGAGAAELERLVRASAGGLAGGRLRAAAPAPRLLPLVVDRGGAVEAVGGGPTMPLDESERAAARALLASHPVPADGLAPVREALRAPLPPSFPGVRPIRIAGPAEGLEGAGDALSDARWWSRLAAVSLDGDPAAAARAFQARVEEVLGEVPRTRDRRQGIAIFAGAPLDCVDGAGEGVATERFLRELRGTVRRRELRYAIFRTAGARGGAPGLASGTFDASHPESPTEPIAYTARPGVTDVGPIVVALRPEPAGR